MKADHSNFVLWWVVWSGKEHEMLEYQRSWIYEKQDIGLTLKLVYSTFLHEPRVIALML